MIPTWTPESNNAEHAARVLIGAAMWMHSTFKNEVWLWRGQSRSKWGIEPSAHTRVLDAPANLRTDEAVGAATNNLITVARRLGVDQYAGASLPDLALLAHLQHHGAATPLIDVTTDPLIGLWMVAFADAERPEIHDEESGALFGILKPPASRWLEPLDARPFWSSEMPDVTTSLEGDVFWYEPPYVTERLRIQRGSFLVGRLAHPTRRCCTVGLEVVETDWAARRFANRGSRKCNVVRRGEVFKIIVRGSVKKQLRTLLKDRSGLSSAAVFPSPTDHPFLEQFAQSYGRRRSLLLDISDPSEIERYREVREPSFFPDYQGPPMGSGTDATVARAV